MKSIRLFAVILLLLPALAHAQSFLFDASELSVGKSGTTKVKTWLVIPLSRSETWDICPFALNDQPKKCKTTYTAEAFLADSDTPFQNGVSLGVIPGSLNPRPSNGIAFDSGCIPLAASGFDYALIVVEFAKKTCRKKISSSSLIEFGAIGLPTAGTMSSSASAEGGRGEASFGPGITHKLHERPVK